MLRALCTLPIFRLLVIGLMLVGRPHAAPIEEALTESDTSSPTLESVEDRFSQGIKAYEEQNPSGALAIWKDLVNADYDGFELWFNMANAAWRLGEIPEAKLYWMRAALHEPFDADLHINLTLAESACLDRVEEAPRLALWKHLDRMFLLVPKGMGRASALLMLWCAMGLVFAIQMGWLAFFGTPLWGALALSIGWVVFVFNKA